MNCIILVLLFSVITMGMSGCAASDNKARAGAVVGEKPKAPGSTETTPSPDSNSLDRENIAAVSAPRGPRDMIVQIGDVLEVEVAEDRSFDGYYEVRLGGYFILPSVGRIDAGGLPLKEVQANITRALEETQLPHATVKVAELGGTHNGRQRQ